MNSFQENIAESIVSKIRNDGWVYMRALRIESEEKGVSNEDWNIACNALYELNIIKEIRENSGKVSLTETVGTNFPGFEIYKEQEKERKDLEKRKLIVDVGNAERIYKSYPLTKIAAWVGAISGLILLFQKLIEWYNKLR